MLLCFSPYPAKIEHQRKWLTVIQFSRRSAVLGPTRKSVQEHSLKTFHLVGRSPFFQSDAGDKIIVNQPWQCPRKQILRRSSVSTGRKFNTGILALCLGAWCLGIVSLGHATSPQSQSQGPLKQAPLKKEDEEVAKVAAACPAIRAHRARAGDSSGFDGAGAAASELSKTRS